MGRSAFTLIEVIGVLAVIAILASMMVPVVIRQIDHAVWNQEVINLGAMSNAIVLQAIRNKTISSTNSWMFDAAAWLNMAPGAIATNSRNNARIFLADPSGWLGNPASFNPQSTNGTGNPIKARVILLSSIGAPITATGNFDDVWNTPEKMVPSSWVGWRGSGEDLVIQRINLQPLFHRVILYNRDAPNGAWFTIDTNGPAPVLTPVDSYYLDGSVLGLSISNVNDASPTNFSTEVVNKDMSRIYEATNWTADVGPGPLSSASSNFQSIVTTFLLSDTNKAAGVVDSVTAYMNAYSSWANTCFLGGTGTNSYIPQNQMLQAVISCFTNGPCAIVPPQ